MSATPAEVANDLEAQGRYFHRRDDDVSRLCEDTARLIRALLAGQRVDGRTHAGLCARLANRSPRYPADSQIGKSLDRAQRMLLALRSGDPGRPIDKEGMAR